MAKMDYTKVEKMIEKALLDGTMKKLLKLADLIESFGDPDAVDMRTPIPHPEAVASILAQIHKTLTDLRKKNLEAYNKLNLDKDWLRQMTEDPQVVKHEDWEKIKEMRLKVLQYIKETDKETETAKTDDQIIKEEKKSHITKRFNVRDRWWPV